MGVREARKEWARVQMGMWTPANIEQIVDKTIMEADLDRDGKISFEEFTKMVENTDVSMSMTLDQF